jgi:hypothetical protein
MSEQIIYAMSTLGETNLTRFTEISKRLYTPEDDGDHDYSMRFQMVRYLEALGYCEFDYDQRRVFMCPPALVLLPSFGLPRVLLTGARTPKFVEQIKKSVKERKDKAVFNKWKQKNDQMNLPDAAVIEAVDTGILREIASENNISLSAERPAAWDLANQSVSVEIIEGGLHFESRPEINWARRNFNVQRLGFLESQADGYHLSEYTNPDNHQKRHWLWNGNAAANVNRDWGRYIVLMHAEKKILFYDEETQELQVPLWVPLPSLLARAVTLCSGMAPLIRKSPPAGDVLEGCLLQVYSDVPVEIARIVSAKTGQKIFSVE